MMNLHPLLLIYLHPGFLILDQNRRMCNIDLKSCGIKLPLRLSEGPLSPKISVSEGTLSPKISVSEGTLSYKILPSAHTYNKLIQALYTTYIQHVYTCIHLYNVRVKGIYYQCWLSNCTAHQLKSLPSR